MVDIHPQVMKIISAEMDQFVTIQSEDVTVGFCSSFNHKH